VTDGASSQLHVPHCALDRTLGGSLFSDVKNKNPCWELIAGRAGLIQCLTDSNTRVPCLASDLVRNYKEQVGGAESFFKS
jgi:hypothetical protein